MDVFPLLVPTEPRTFQGRTRNIPARAEKEDLGAHHVVLGAVIVCVRGRPGRRAILWRHGGDGGERQRQTETECAERERESSRGPREGDRGDGRVARAGACLRLTS